MKKIIFLIILVSSIIVQQTSARTIISSIRTSNSYGIPVLPQSPVTRVCYAPSAAAVNITIKDETGKPELTTAINLAKKYLGEVIKEDFPITILIKMGQATDFSDTYGTYEHLAITTSHYVLNNYENRNPNTLNSYSRLINNTNTLIPEALANREYLGDTDPDNPDITILLNPQKNFFIGEDYTQISDNQYDLVTVLLREMVTGCGFASSLYMSDTDPLSSMKLSSDNVYYPVLFDRGLTNNDNVDFSSINHDENSIINIASFLTGKNLFFRGNAVFNDDVVGNGISLNTTNRTYSSSEDPNNPDLMTWNYRIGKSSVIRKITPKTAAVLNSIGWDIDVITGSSANFPIVNNNGTGFTINPGQNYSFRGNITGMYDYNLSSFDLVLVKLNGDHYTYKTGYAFLNLLSFNYNVSEIPASEEWQRDPETGYIIGYIKLSGTGQSGSINYYISGFQRVLLVLNPLKVKIAATKQNVTTTSMDANVVYDSNGATQYKINYTAYGEASGNIITVNNKQQVAYILSSLNPAKRYSVYVQGINTSGSATSETVTIGSTYTAASCVFSKTGTDAKYQIKVGETIMNDLVINSAGIYNTSGVLKMTVPTVPNQYFSIASLPTGVYVLKVIVKDYGLCSKSFLK